MDSPSSLISSRLSVFFLLFLPSLPQKKTPLSRFRHKGVKLRCLSKPCSFWRYKFFSASLRLRLSLLFSSLSQKPFALFTFFIIILLNDGIILRMIKKLSMIAYHEEFCILFGGDEGNRTPDLLSYLVETASLKLINPVILQLGFHVARAVSYAFLASFCTPTTNSLSFTFPSPLVSIFS
jgi:hypothetical protein